MKLRSIVACSLAALLVASSAHAQAQPNQWRSYAERLGPRALVVVELTGGRRVEGRIIQVTDDEVSVLPKTRIRVPVRRLLFSEIQSIDVRKDGWSPGAKVLTGVASAGGVLLVVALAALASAR